MSKIDWNKRALAVFERNARLFLPDHKRLIPFFYYPRMPGNLPEEDYLPKWIYDSADDLCIHHKPDVALRYKNWIFEAITSRYRFEVHFLALRSSQEGIELKFQGDKIIETGFGVKVIREKVAPEYKEYLVESGVYERELETACKRWGFGGVGKKTMQNSGSSLMAYCIGKCIGGSYEDHFDEQCRKALEEIPQIVKGLARITQDF
jgi:hypothetical protein